MTSLILTCPSCGSRYEVEADDVLPSGRKVQCGHCAHVWREPPPQLGQAAVDSPTRFEPEPPEPEPNYDEPARAAGLEPDAGSETSNYGTARYQDEEPPAYRNDPQPSDVAHAPLDTGAESPRRLTTMYDQPLAAPVTNRAGPPVQAQKRGGAIALAILAVVIIAFVNIAWFWRQDIVTAYPPARQIYAIVGLEPASYFHIEKSASRITEGGVTYLEIAGTIINVSDRQRELPELIGRLSNNERETVHQWSFATEKSILEPGEFVNFTSRVEDRNDAACLNIYFYEPGDRNPEC